MNKLAYAAGVKEAAGLFGYPWANVKHDISNAVIGQPREVMNQARKGTLTAPGGLLRNALVPSTTLGKVLNWGLPAAAMGLSAAYSKPETRGSDMGQIAGGALGGLLGQPLGVLGQAAGSAIFSPLGKTIGSMFDKKPDPAVQNHL